jgi:lipoic acid synthetase
METVERLYRDVRPGASIERSLSLLKDIKIKNSKVFTKSGIMIGLGETYDEIKDIMSLLIDSNVDFFDNWSVSKAHHKPPSSY